MENTRLKQSLFIAGVIALLAFSYSVIAYVNVFSQSVQPGSFRSFAVTGEGKAVVVPDVAEFSASVISQGGKDLAALQTENTTKTNKIIDFLKAQGVKAEDIQTSGYQLDPRYQYYACPRNGGACPPADIVGYTITQTIKVKVRDFTTAGGILAGTVDAGANSVTQLNFTVDDPLLVQAEARGKAIASAKKQAEAVAEAGGFSLGKILSIDEGGVQPIMMEKLGYGMGGDMAVSAPTVAPQIEPGSKDFTVQVTLRYEIN